MRLPTTIDNPQEFIACLQDIIAGQRIIISEILSQNNKWRSHGIVQHTLCGIAPELPSDLGDLNDDAENFLWMSNCSFPYQLCLAATCVLQSSASRIIGDGRFPDMVLIAAASRISLEITERIFDILAPYRKIEYTEKSDAVIVEAVRRAMPLASGIISPIRLIDSHSRDCYSEPFVDIYYRSIVVANTCPIVDCI